MISRLIQATTQYVCTNHAPWHITRRGTLGPGSRASTSTPPPWWGNENHGLTLRVCPCSAHERTPATTFTQRTPSPDESIRSNQLIPPQERRVNAHTSFSSRTAFKRASQPVVPSSELQLNWSTRPQGAQQNNAREARCHRSLSPKAAAPLP